MRGELTAAESRELALKSLDDPELFEELTSSAVTKAALSAPSVQTQLKQADSETKIIRFPRRARAFIGAAAAAAAVIFISLYSLRSPPLPPNRSPSTESSTISRLKPGLYLSAKPGEPVLLASGLLSEPARREGIPVFRGLERDNRSPRPAGSIVAIEDGVATIDLGSLDGVANGSELSVFRDERSTQPVGRLMATTVFRERARARILSGQIQVHHRVRIAAVDHLGSLLEQVNALAGRGDPNSARTVAQRAVDWAQTANVPPGAIRKAWERLAGLEVQAGSLQAAEQRYQSVVDSLNAEPPASLSEQSVAFNNLAVVRLLNGDYGGAESPLNQAVSKSPKTDIAYGRSVNNLGVLAELRGDRLKAEALYSDAQRAFAGLPGSSVQERRVVETNLARLKNVR